VGHQLHNGTFLILNKLKAAVAVLNNNKKSARQITPQQLPLLQSVSLSLQTALF